MTPLPEVTAAEAADDFGWFDAHPNRSSRLTVLTSVSRLYATKRIRQHRKTGKVIKTPYGCETHFRVKQVDLSGFDHLCKCLDALTQRPFAFVIRGEPLSDTDLNKTRRLAHSDPETGEAAAFAEHKRSWFAGDVDKVKKPAALDPIADPEGAIEYLIGLLPPELHDASCWWQFTCSQSLPGCEDRLSARLWFWLLDPLDDASLTRWAHCANKVSKLIDPSIYRVVQPHYIADPVFEEGMRDPLPRRHGVRIGLDKAVSLLIPEPSADDRYVGGDGYVGLGIEGHLAEIGGERGFRAPMVSAIAAYFTANGSEANPDVIKARVREAIAHADPGGRTAAELDRYCSDRHLNDIVEWVRARERVNPRPATTQSPGEFLQSLSGSVPVGSERVKTIRAIAQHLLRQRYLNPRLAVSLVDAFNQVRCTPPLPNEQVRAIVNALATREINAATGANNA
jgi:hypothetical protein